MNLKYIGILLAAVTVCYGQPPDTLWTRSFGGGMLDEFYELASTTDGGYVAVGGTRSFGAGDIDMWVVKTDSLGSLLWSRTFGGIYDDRAQAVFENPDGTLMVAGHISGDTSRYLDAALLKLDANGDSLWGHIYGGNRDETMTGVLPVEDGGYILAGITGSFGAGAYDFWLLKVSEVGDSAWSRTYGGAAFEIALQIQSTPNGGYALAGHTGSFDIGGEDIWLLKVNSQGDSLWSRAYGGVGLEECLGMCTTSDGGFLLVGDTESFGGGWVGYAAKADSVGNLEWQRTYGQGLQLKLDDALQLPDGNYVASGYYTYDVGDARAWLIKLNGDGDTLWTRQWGGPQSINRASGVLRADAGEYVLAGLRDYHLSWQTGDGWLLKTEEDPLSADEREPPIPHEIDLTIYPNPFNSLTRLVFNVPRLSMASINLYNLAGQNVRNVVNGRYAPGEHVVMLNGEGLASGIYFVRVEAGEMWVVKKIALMK